MGRCAKIVSASTVFFHTEPSHTQNYQSKSHCAPVNLHRALTTVQKTNGTRGRGKQPRASAPFPWKQGSSNTVDTYLRTKHFLSGFQLINLYHWPHKLPIRPQLSSKLFNMNKWISETLLPSSFLTPDSKLTCIPWLSYHLLYCPQPGDFPLLFFTVVGSINLSLSFFLKYIYFARHFHQQKLWLNVLYE